MEAANTEHTQMHRTISLKEAALEDSGERFGDHMEDSSPTEEPAAWSKRS